METWARLSSKGQITVPKSVRQALGLHEGDRVVFRVEGRRATMARTPDLLELAGSVPVPAELRGRPWSEIIAVAHAERARRIVEGPGRDEAGS